MLEESVVGMEKKATARQSSNLVRSTVAFERKNETSSAKFHGRSSKRRENGSGQSTWPDNYRRPVSQKNRISYDKRPRQRGGVGDRPSEEIVDVEGQDWDSAHSGRRGNLNHLLNFQYAARDPAPSQRPRPRLRRARSVHNKERFLQANCQFVVKDSGDYRLQAQDPDALVDWDLVQQVRKFSHGQTTCPICLHVPCAGQITKCGHVYCWACILHYLSLDDKSWSKCPICFEAIHKSELRSVHMEEKTEVRVGDTVTLQLMKRERDSTHAVPASAWTDRKGLPQSITDVANTEFAKILVASPHYVHTAIINAQRQALQQHLASAEPSEECFIESALSELADREALLGTRDAGKTNLGTEGATADIEGETTARPLPPPRAALAKDVSFDGSKIRKQYADAFEELEQEAGSAWDDSWPDDEDDWTESTSLPSPGPEDWQNADSDTEVLADTQSIGSVDVRGTDQTEAPMLENSSIDGSQTDQSEASASTHKERLRFAKNRNHSKNAFYFYQASDGQHVYLHSVNARCIDHQYRGLEHGPPTITAKVVDRQITFMTQAMRQRLRYLGHLPLTCELTVVEVMLEPPIVSSHTLDVFAGDLKKRAQQRQKVKREDRRQARKQRIEEKKTYGIYPEVQLALDNPHHFPAPVGGTDDRQRRPSYHDNTSLPSPSASESVGADCAGEAQSPPGDEERGSFSFAAALKKKKEPAAVRIAADVARPSHNVVRADSDGDDGMPVPAFQSSFSDAVSVAMEAAGVKDKESKGGKKKKKKETKLLFSTSMMRH